MTTTAVERGRSLVVTFGTPGEEGSREIVVKPINAKLGASLYALWAGIAFAQSEQVETDAVSMGKLAVGEEHWDLLEDELRWQESSDLIHSAFLWNVQGGGIDLVHTYLEQNGATGGLPKAQELLVERNGHSKAFGLLKTLLSSDEADETPEPDATSATSIPTGSAS